jgi:hypothetical protein
MHPAFITSVIGIALFTGNPGALQQADDQTTLAATPAFTEAQRLFYIGQYRAASAAVLALRAPDPDYRDLPGYELRTSALHFQLKRALGEQKDRKKAMQQCGSCPELMAIFMSDIAAGQVLARARVESHPEDDWALFYLAKIDLNYVWLQLGTVGRKTGWHEYWEGRKALDTLLKRNPQHVRARVARAWVDYIVDTKMSWSTSWLLGGGSKERALTAVRESAAAESDFFTEAEAEFALWDMLVREGKLVEAMPSARRLAQDFPENTELVNFLAGQSVN